MASGQSATGMKPVAGANGAITFLFGAQQPSIVCAVLQVCDVALQAGEQVNSINLGDTARWTVEPAITGSGAGRSAAPHHQADGCGPGNQPGRDHEPPHLSLPAALASHRSTCRKCRFTYPEDALAKWDAIKTREVKEPHRQHHPANRRVPGRSDRLTMTCPARPPGSRCASYNDGRKTIIQMPRSMEQTEAPTLLVVRNDGGLFTDD